MKKTMPGGPAWLRDAIFYQIYPQSFCDTNGDGIGDIPGVTAKLDYIKSVGCNVVWLNPCFDSPFGDAGYDISDFYKIAPRYGTHADLKQLFNEAHKRGMRVVLDLVAGHTSIEHEWFKESARPGKNKYSDRFVWTNSVWKSPGTGFDGVRGYSERDGQYVTNFFHFQPALNYGFANPDPKEPWQLPVTHPAARATRNALWDILQYWLDMGADGFRVDMAFSLVKNDPGCVATSRLWRGIRKEWEKKYPEAALISEWSIPKQAIGAGFHIDFMIHFGTPAYTGLFRSERSRDAFGVSKPGHSLFDRGGKGDIKSFLKIYLDQFNATRSQGYISIPTGNHDITRISAGRRVNDLKVIFAFLLTLPGAPCIYYGDEIGMRNVAGLPSKEGGYGRTGARTPMQWNKKRNAGFSTAGADRLYLPLDPDTDRPDVESQEGASDSLLHLVRTLCRFRRESKALGSMGDFNVLHARKNEYPFVFQRSLDGEKFIVLLNPASEKKKILLKGQGRAEDLILKVGEGVTISNSGKSLSFSMEAVSFALFQQAGKIK